MFQHVMNALTVVKIKKTVNYKECQMPAGNNENEFDHDYIYKPLSLRLIFRIMIRAVFLLNPFMVFRNAKRQTK